MRSLLLLSLLLPLLLTTASVQAAAPDATAPRSPSFSAGGFLKLDLMQSDTAINRQRRGAQWLSAPDIPAGAPHPDATQHFAHAKESRLWFRGTTPAGRSAVDLYVEYDLFKGGSTYQGRLRHAYVTYGKLLAGQTWTTFASSAALADVDSGIAIGNIATRRAQLRWTQAVGDNGNSLSLALEESLNRITRSGATALLAGEEQHPDLVLGYNFRPQWGNVTLAALARHIAWRDTTRAQTQGAWGGALGLSGRIDLRARDNLRFTLAHGSALATHVAGTFADATVASAGPLQLNTLHSAHFAWQHLWNPRWRSTLAAGTARARLPEFASTVLTREVNSLQMNLIWAPRPALSAGLEYLHAKRILLNGTAGSLNRVQLSLRYNY